MLGHHAASNAPRTSRLTTDVQFFCFKFSSMISLTAIAASTVSLWGMKPYWLLFKPALVCTWCIILSLINLSTTLRATLSKLMGQYFEVSLLSSFPGFTIGTMLDFFHCLGKLPSFRHLLYTSVRKDGKFPKTRRSISLVSPSSPGAFLGLNFFITVAISSREKGLSSSVPTGSFICSLICLWTALSFVSLSLGEKNSLTYALLCFLCPRWRSRLAAGELLSRLYFLISQTRFYKLCSKGWTPQLRSSTFAMI